MDKTFAEKILAKYGEKKQVEPGEIVTVSPDHLLTHDNTAPITDKIKDELNEYGLCSSALPVIVLDHVVPAASEKTATNHQIIREFVEKQDIENFFDAGVGVCHQVIVEKGLALPGKLVVGSDSHTCSYGAVGCFSTGIDRTEAASIMLTCETWLKVPESAKIVLNGSLPSGVYPKDLILDIIGDVSASGMNYQSVEYHGDVKQFSVDERFTICNMGVEMGAKNSVFPFDKATKKFLDDLDVKEDEYDVVQPDKNASYKKQIDYDLSNVSPVIACPHSVDNVKTVEELEGLTVDQCLIGTCTNGRFSDLKKAAEILKNQSVHPDVRLLVAPASKEIYQKALKNGLLEIFVKAGGIILPPGCGPCLGAHQGCLAPSERCISTANRNFKGRMGCKDAEIYLGSPATVASAAIHGEIVDPREEV
ncbi:MAG: 3-isopropylmalate dehydratase large subunit [Candidatus Thermoplasmatota archaeon]